MLALFCLPLFIDLGRLDIQNDEAIYSFGVDRILEIGDWLAPRSSPQEDAVFLEKPPLKFWIVAAPIQLGLLPHNEFGIRFWDALFGTVAFFYVFAIGSRLAGPVCGAVALLMLFVHYPLIFEHGLRQNNMEAPLFLCYCGGVFHFLEWARRARGPGLGTVGDADRASRPAGASGAGRHALAVGLYFVLGFMTKFVAALFLPLVLVTGCLAFRPYRTALLQDWRRWGAVVAVVLLLVAPWFVYANLRFGWYLWEVILGAHVITRFTHYLDPGHLQPWYFYLDELYRYFRSSGTHGLVGLGLLVLLVQSIRRRSLDGLIILSWFALPMFCISLGTSKLYHYAYPFLPPLTLAAGYVVALVLMLAPVPVERLLSASDGYARTARAAVLKRPSVRILLLTVSAVAIALAVVSLVYGPVRLKLGGVTVFRSSGILRPIIVAVLAGLLAGAYRTASRAVVPLLVASVLPLPTYQETLARLGTGKHPMRSSSQCIQRVQAQGGVPVPSLYLDLPDSVIGHRCTTTSGGSSHGPERNRRPSASSINACTIPSTCSRSWCGIRHTGHSSAAQSRQPVRSIPILPRRRWSC